MDTLVIRDGSLARAAEVILSGGLAGVPTETVYGLAADGLNGAAVERIYEVKGRPETKPINLLVPDMAAVGDLCRDIPEDAFVLADSFWPGPLTMILRKNALVPEIVTAGGCTVGVRCPDHPLTLELLRMCARPLAAPSANPSGEPSPKSALDVLRYFDGEIECVIDGGKCSVGVESTIIDMTSSPYRILRQGGLPKEEIEAALGKEVAG